MFFSDSKCSGQVQKYELKTISQILVPSWCFKNCVYTKINIYI